MDRRNFLKLIGAGGASLLANPLKAGAKKVANPKEFVGVLVDTTRCIGCRACEVACGETHNLLVPDTEKDNALDNIRDTSEKQRTVVNRFKTSRGDIYVKKQCMHCWQPACTAACLTKAMEKTKDGPIIWRENKCMGCRFCMVSCPFDVPKFEYHTWNPDIIKCDMCWDRLKEGKQPACVQACPQDALMFGLKRNLMEIARTRIYRHPKKYVRQIYGENEVGGTGWLYLSAVPFKEIGFKTNLGNIPYPEYTKSFLYTVPAVILVVPPLLYGISQLSKKEDDPYGHKGGDHD